MSPPRLFIPQPLHPGATITTSANQGHYLGRVMRRSEGDPVILFNGQDGEWQASITRIGKHDATLHAHTQLRVQAAEQDLWLLFAPLKRDATDLLVEKATELGVSALCPVTTERTNTPRLNQDRMRAIAIEAAEQSERLTIPAFHAIRPLSDWLSIWPMDRTLVAALETPRSERMSLPIISGAAALLIGPEGGFTDAESTRLRAHASVSPACLGRRILRAETAAIAGLALIQAAAP